MILEWIYSNTGMVIAIVVQLLLAAVSLGEYWKEQYAREARYPNYFVGCTIIVYFAVLIKMFGLSLLLIPGTIVYVLIFGLIGTIESRIRHVSFLVVAGSIC